MFCYKTTSLSETNIFHIVVGLCRPLHLFMFTNSKINWIKNYYSDKVIAYLISTRKKKTAVLPGIIPCPTMSADSKLAKRYIEPLVVWITVTSVEADKVNVQLTSTNKRER